MEEISKKEKFNFIEFYKKYSVVINCAILSGLFLANCFLPWFTFIAHSFLLVLVLFCDIKRSISYLFFCFVFNSLYLPYSAIIFALCVATMMIRLIIIKNKEDKSNFNISTKTLVCYILFVVYLIIPFGREFDFVYVEKVFYLALAPVLLYLFAKFANEFNLRHNLRMLLYGLIVACSLSFFKPISLHLQTIIETHYADGIYRYPALFVNPNTLAMTCEICFSLMAFFIIKHNAKAKDAITFLMFFFIGCFTLSKTFMIISSFNFLILAIFAIIKRSKNMSLLFCTLIIGFGVIFLIRPDVIIAWFSRLFGILDKNSSISDSFNKLTTGRFGLWVVYLSSMVNRPVSFIFGNGLSAPVLSVESPHNLYISMFYQIGAVGIILLVLTVVFMLKDVRKGKEKMSKAYLVPLLSFALLALVEDLMFYVF